jgi:uncharacterized RDD family membrane protein YckC
VSETPVRGALPFETASWGRRILALVVDWLISTAIVVAFVGLDTYSEPGSPAQVYTLLVYVLESTLMTWLGGGSIGKLLTGLCVVPAEGPLRRLNPVKVLARQLLVVLVIPPLVFRPDGRGLHDMVAGTATVTFGTLHELRS